LTEEIKTFEFPMRFFGFKVGGVNCYLVKTNTSSVLIDTGFPSNRADLERELENAGCSPGNPRLIIMTHGDLDHSGNGACLREKYGAKIAMHIDEFEVVEKGDDTLSRRRRSLPRRTFDKAALRLLSWIARSGSFERFTPDIAVGEGYDLSEYGFDAKVLHIPGHSKGSIGILTAEGDLFCGDLLWNMRKPSIHSIVDNRAELQDSVDRLKTLDIRTVYPGHGKPFPMKDLSWPRPYPR